MCKGSISPPQWPRQLGHVRRDAPRLVARELLPGTLFHPGLYLSGQAGFERKPELWSAAQRQNGKRALTKCLGEARVKI